MRLIFPCFGSAPWLLTEPGATDWLTSWLSHINTMPFLSCQLIDWVITVHGWDSLYGIGCKKEAKCPCVLWSVLQFFFSLPLQPAQHVRTLVIEIKIYIPVLLYFVNSPNAECAKTVDGISTMLIILFLMYSYIFSFKRPKKNFFFTRLNVFVHFCVNYS